MKWFLGIGLWFLLVVVELSLLRSLPFPWCTLPCVFAVSVYLLQHHRILQAIGWIGGYGIVLDVFHLGLVPFETLPLLAGTAVAWFGSRWFFSHRSYYGLLANAFCAFGTVWMVRAGEWVIVWFFHPERVQGSVLLSLFFVQTILFFFLISLLFFSAKKIRRFLSLIFFIPKIS